MTDNIHEQDEIESAENENEEPVTAPVADLVAAALDGNALQVQETFNMLVIDRIQALIEERKPIVADQLLNPEEVDEDVDEDDEDTVEEETNEDEEEASE